MQCYHTSMNTGLLRLKCWKDKRLEIWKVYCTLLSDEQFSKTWDSVSCCFSSFALAPAPLSRKAAACEGARLEDPQLATLHQTVATAGSHIWFHQIKLATKSKLPLKPIFHQIKRSHCRFTFDATRSNWPLNQICRHRRFTFDAVTKSNEAF